MLQNPDESKPEDKSGRGDEPGEFTRMFRTLREEPTMAAPPAVEAATEKVPTAPMAAASADGDGFTQIFQQIKRPTSAPPDLSSAAPPAAAGGGEFTQIFTGYQGAPKAEVPMAAPAPVAPPAAVPQASEGAPGAFTQLFQKTIPSPEPTAAPQTPRAAEARPEPQPQPQTGFGSAAGHEFGAPAPAGSFTEVFRTAPKQPAASPGPLAQDAAAARFAAPQTPHPAASGESSFTQMFQALGETPATQEPARPAAPGLVFGSGPASPAAPLLAASAPAAAGAGEFTRLMQSLQQPVAAPSASAQPPQAVSAPPVFAQPSQAIGGSEFTRVMRGPAPASGVAHATVSAPQASSAPGMAIAPAKTEEKPKEQGGGKSKQMILLLVGLNILLLLALIVLAVVLLRRH